MREHSEAVFAGLLIRAVTYMFTRNEREQHMQPYQERVVQEKQELDQKLAALQEFLLLHAGIFRRT